MKQVNIAIQCIATLITPTGLYCFKRIQKLRMGIILYVISYILTGIAGLYSAFALQTQNYSYETVSMMFLLGSIMLPALFMKKWSQEWNKKIINKSESISSHG